MSQPRSKNLTPEERIEKTYLDIKEIAESYGVITESRESWINFELYGLCAQSLGCAIGCFVGCVIGFDDGVK